MKKSMIFGIGISLMLATPVMAEDTITLSDEEILVNGVSVEQFEGVTVGSDIIYYEDRDTYDSGNTYGEGTDADKHTAEEAAEHTVVTITQPGTYRVSGTLSKGQLAIDLGENAERDPEAVVSIIFDGADITCSVAPAVIFYNVYECNEAWVAYDKGETEAYEGDSETDLTNAGAKVIIADDSVNNIHGAYVARIFKDDENQKKKYKFDGAFYSKRSMTIDGETSGNGVLNIVGDNEGLDTEMHLTINGGEINIQSQDDGINTNEDNVSVTTINGGKIHICGGLGQEGDGIDSNGYLVINGGTVVASANPGADAGLDSDLGSFINGGYVISTGSTMDWPESDSNQVTMNLQFAQMQDAEESIVVKDKEGNIVFAYDPEKDEAQGVDKRSYQGAVLSCSEFTVGETYQVYVGDRMQTYAGNELGRGGRGAFNGDGRRFQDGEMPEGFEKGERPEGFEKGERLEGFEKGERPEGFEKGERPEGFGKGERPEGFEEGERPEDSETRQRPEGFTRGNRQGATGQNSSAEASTEFTMTDKVNAFASVSDDVSSEGETKETEAIINEAEAGTNETV